MALTEAKFVGFSESSRQGGGREGILECMHEIGIHIRKHDVMKFVFN